jgi:sporulation protein YlmC with PRC-barrel domain
MIRASDLLGCVVHTESGKKVGRVHDLRAKTTQDDCLLVGLVVGRGGMLARLVGDGIGRRGCNSGNLIPWEMVTRLADGHIIVRDSSL